MVRAPEYQVLAETADPAHAMRAHVVRYADLVSLAGAGIDTPLASSPSRAMFAIIATGQENRSHGYLHISEPHGFAVNGVRHPASCRTVLESHDAVQVIIVHTGHWQLQLGLGGELGSFELGPGDVASIPADVCRGLHEQSDEGGFALLISGNGHSTKSAAAETPTGTWIDVSSGVPQLKESATAADRGADDPPTCVIRASAAVSNERSPLHAAGVAEAGIIGSRPTRDGFEHSAASVSWPHGFCLRQLAVSSGGYVPLHSRSEYEVLFVQSGALEVSLPDGTVMIAAGDTMSVSAGMPRAFRNTSSQTATLFVIRGSEDPAAPQFQSVPVHISAA